MADKVAVVTGGGTGIGRASALALARDGFAVVIAGRRQEPLDETVKKGKADGGTLHAVVTDVSDPEAVRALFAETKRRFGRLDVLFNNAGPGAPGIPLHALFVAPSLPLVRVILNVSSYSPPHTLTIT